MSSCRTANIDRFVETVAQHDNLDVVVEERYFCSFVKDLALAVDFEGLVTTEEEAQSRLIAEDLRRLTAVDLVNVELPQSVEQSINDCEPAIRARLEEIGLTLSASNLFVVDSFPSPFDNFDWAAFAPDREDEEEFGIARGVYFKRAKLRPLYSQALYAHEAIHTITGQVDPEIYAGGLEEGVAEVVGTCYGGLAVLSPIVLKNILVYGRHGVQRPKIWSFYRDHMRQAFLLYNEFGLTGLVALISRGRAAIHAAAAAIVDGTYRDLALPVGGFDDATREVLEFACLGFVPSHAYSPIDCLLAIYVQSGRTIGDICKLASVDPTVGESRIRAVSTESALYMMNGKSIGYSNMERLLRMEEMSGTSLLRYIPLELR
jgi:hypothetical protein